MSSSSDCSVMSLAFPSLRISASGCCGSSGIQCDSTGRITRLDLGGNQLGGTIPSQLGNLNNLRQLYLNNNQLTGAIPQELGNLRILRELGLYNNRLTEPIPPQLGNLSNLEYLSLAGNRLTEPIPPQLGNLSNLEYLELDSNQLSGVIPPELGNLSNLQILALDRNQLVGPIPPQLGSLNDLTQLRLNDNQLEGTIPPQLGSLSSLRELYLDNNDLLGVVPEYVSNLSVKRIQGNCFSDIRNSSAYNNITQRSYEDCQRNSPALTTSSNSPVLTTSSSVTLVTLLSTDALITETSKAVSTSLTPSDSAAPVTSISPDTSLASTSNVVSPGLITGVVLGIIVILGAIAVTFHMRRRRCRHSTDVSTKLPISESDPTPSSSNHPPAVPPKIHDMVATVTRPSLPIPTLQLEPLPPPDDPRNSKSTFFSGLNAIPTGSSSRIDKDYDVIPAVTDVLNEKAEELTHLGSVTLDRAQGSSRYNKANEARMDRVIAPARGSSMMVMTSGTGQRSRNYVASWSCEDVENWLSENGFALVVLEKFKSHQIDGYQLLLLSSNRLVEMGITVETMRDNLLYAVERLRVPMSPGIGVSTAGSMTFANDAPPQYT